MIFSNMSTDDFFSTKNKISVVYPSQSLELGGIDVWIDALEVHADAKGCSAALPPSDVAARALRDPGLKLVFLKL